MFEPKVIEALAQLRKYAARYPTMGLSDALNTLDDAGVFAALDEQSDYAAAEDILAEAALASVQGLGDGRHRRVPLDEPLVGAEAERMREQLAAPRGMTLAEARAMFGDTEPEH